MSVKLLTAHHLDFLSLKGDCTSSSESILVKMSHCWKSHVAAQIHASPPPLFAECVQMRIQDFLERGITCIRCVCVGGGVSSDPLNPLLISH